MRNRPAGSRSTRWVRAVGSYAVIVAAGTSLPLLACTGCERREQLPAAREKEPHTNPTTSTSANLNAQPNAALPPTSQASALILRHRGPSDRPPPVLVFAPTRADADRAVQDETLRSPIGATPIVVPASDFSCLIEKVPEGNARVVVLEIEICGPTARRTLLDAAQASRWLEAAQGCVGEATPASGYLRSARATVPAG